MRRGSLLGFRTKQQSGGSNFNLALPLVDNLNDVSGNGLAFTAHGGAAVAGGSLALSNSQYLVSDNASALFDYNEGDLSIGFQIKTSQNNRYVLQHSNGGIGGTTGGRWIFYIDHSYKLNWYSGTGYHPFGTPPQVQITSGSDIVTGSWVNVVATFDRSTGVHKLYFDGSLDADYTSSDVIPGGKLGAISEKLLIGVNNDGSGSPSGNGLNGELRRVFILPEVLSGSDVEGVFDWF